MGKYKYILVIIMIVGITTTFVYKIGSKLIDDNVSNVEISESSQDSSKELDSSNIKPEKAELEERELQVKENDPIENKKVEFTEEINKNEVKNQAVKAKEDTIESNETNEVIEDEYVDDVYDDNIKFMRSDGQNNVIVDVNFTNPIVSDDIQKNNFVFEVFFTTHSYDISEKELNKKLRVKINNIEIKNSDIQWAPMGIPEGHHVAGNILIPKDTENNDLSSAEITSIEIIMNDVAGAKLRTFEWTKEELK